MSITFHQPIPTASMVQALQTSQSTCTFTKKMPDGQHNMSKRQHNNRSFHTYSINVSWSLRTVVETYLEAFPSENPSLTVRQRTVVVTASEDMVLDPMDAVVARGGLLSDKLWWLRREEADRGGQNQAQEFICVYISCVWYMQLIISNAHYICL